MEQWNTFGPFTFIILTLSRDNSIYYINRLWGVSYININYTYAEKKKKGLFPKTEWLIYTLNKELKK